MLGWVGTGSFGRGLGCKSCGFG